MFVICDRFVTELAIEQAEEYGLLGKEILGTDFKFKIKLVRGASTYIPIDDSIEFALGTTGGEMSSRPPMPMENKYWKKPSEIHNVETICNIPPIISKGGDWFSTIGTPTATGTKVFSVSKGRWLKLAAIHQDVVPNDGNHSN